MVLTCLTISTTYAKKLSNLYSGNWYDGNIWAGGVAPSTLDVVTISSGTVVFANGGYADCDSLTINGIFNVGRTNFTVGGRDLYTDYRAIRNTSCIINGGLRIDGDWDNQFKVYGNMKFNEGSTFEMPAGKIMIDGAAFTPELSVPADKPLLEVADGASFKSTGGLIIFFNPHFFQNGLCLKAAKHFFAVSFGNNDALPLFASRTTNDFFISETVKPTIQNLYLKYLPNPARQNKVVLNEGMSFETMQLAKGVLADKRGSLKFSKDIFFSENTQIECDIELNGTGEQKVGTFTNSSVGIIKGNLIVNNPSKVQIYINMDLQGGTVQFLQGKVDLTDRTMTVSSPPTGANNKAYFITKNNYTASGSLVIKNLDGTTTFPVGTDNDYLPATITAFGGDYSVTARPLAYYPNYGFFPLNMQWDIKRLTGSSSAEIRLQWSKDVENSNFSNNRAVARIFRSESGNWYPVANPPYGITNINSETFSRNIQNIDYFTSFTLLTTVVPVDLKRFYAETSLKNDLGLAWETATKINNAGFDIEKSTNGVLFSTIGFVKGVGNSVALNTYQFTDNNFIKSAYYRLKQLDINGKITYSPVIYVQKNNEKLGLSIYPTLITQEDVLKVDITNAFENTTEIGIFNSNGQLVFSKKLAKNTPSFNIPVNDLVKGIYFVKALNGTNRVASKFVKN
ncbi:MAG: T9SS type A sorting domain-containing protein [Saprospiraceae bacterium]|nr:T9SS type A sorting domain-containing protein [Saprospiraceae bacterium]